MSSVRCGICSEKLVKSILHRASQLHFVLESSRVSLFYVTNWMGGYIKIQCGYLTAKSSSFFLTYKNFHFKFYVTSQLADLFLCDLLQLIISFISTTAIVAQTGSFKSKKKVLRLYEYGTVFTKKVNILNIHSDCFNLYSN